MPRPPKENPARRNPRVGPLILPAKGRTGRPPAWPLPGKPSPEERDAWKLLWGTPQAVAWERLGWTRTVARYCRAMVRAEAPDASAAVLNAVTALEDRLGLTPKAMRLLLWTIASDEVGERREHRQQQSTSPRDRIKAVDTSA
ncbi:hypothetical protein [Micromonospora globbae]|uniref:hypothetical protein n=1 Tax=Micromonospora globbae TaxID=1894969 RepID=UPI0034252B28